MTEPPSSKRMKTCNVGNMEVDRISELPDEILTSILSRLFLKEAQATCVLSSRWRYMWAFSTNLDFEADTRTLDFDVDIGDFEANFRGFDAHIRTDSDVKLELTSYTDWVDSVVNQHRATSIERFRVAYAIDHKSCIDEWIRFAMRKGVQILELDFSGRMPTWSYGYLFSDQVLGMGGFSSFKALCSEYSGFKFLREVGFSHVGVDQGVVEYFIYNCPVLERVSVCVSSTLVKLRVIGQSIALKYLTVRGCFNLKRIEIRRANLISFTYGGELKRLRLRNLPLLVEVSVLGTNLWGTNVEFSYFSCCVSRLEVLKICYIILSEETDPVIPLLPNLKCLEFMFDEANEDALVQLAFLLRQTPRLHNLVIQFRSMGISDLTDDPEVPWAKNRASRCCLDCLKVVKFKEYSGLGGEIELVNYLMKNASNLEKVIFEPVDNSLAKVTCLGSFVELQEVSRAEARKLKEKLPASLDVVCL